MADPDDAPPRSPRDPGREAGSPGVDPAAADELRERVRRQRRHIEGLTGEDPLRGGVDD